VLQHGGGGGVGGGHVVEQQKSPAATSTMPPSVVVPPSDGQNMKSSAASIVRDGSIRSLVSSFENKVAEVMFIYLLYLFSYLLALACFSSSQAYATPYILPSKL